MNATAGPESRSAGSAAYRVAPGIDAGCVPVGMAQARPDRGRLCGRRSAADGDRVCADHRACACGWPLRGHSRAAGLRRLRHFAAPDRQSGCRHVLGDRGGRSCRSPRAIRCLASLSVVLAIFAGLLCFGASWLRLGFLADFLCPADPRRLPQRRGDQHLPRPDRQSIRLRERLRTASLPASSSCARCVPQTHLPTLAVGMPFACWSCSRASVSCRAGRARSWLLLPRLPSSAS